jgi:hypothetical protein
MFIDELDSYRNFFNTPKPDKPALNIDDLRLKIYGIALPPGRRSSALWAGGRGVGAATPTSRRLCSVFSIKIDNIPKIFNLAMT